MSTGFCYDALFLEHDTGHHPESPTRLVAILKALESSRILSRLIALQTPVAGFDDLCLVHSRGYVLAVQRLADRGGGYLDPDTIVSRRSYDAAALAAGSLTAAVDAVLAGEVENCFALVRPPGHHALSDRGMGFCIFNNVAIAAMHARVRHKVSRVLIVDFDLHHGNGTQDIFSNDPNVMYFSIHQYPFYPGTGGALDVGTGPGRGYSVNVPFPSGVGDAGYLAAIDELLVPLAGRFCPDIIVVSAGFDCHWLDPLGAMNLSISGLASVVKRLKHLARLLCSGRLILTLEGGYSERALGAAAVGTFQVLLDESPTDTIGRSGQDTEHDVAALLARLKRVHQLA